MAKPMGLNMSAAPTGTEIPPGWYRLMCGDTAKNGDFCRADFPDYEWEMVDGINGSPIMEDNLSDYGDYIVIRKGTPPSHAEKVDREWMNPWD